MEMTIKEVLIAARAKIADPANWTQGSLAKDDESLTCGVLSEHARCYCAIGAIIASAHSDNCDVGGQAVLYLDKFTDGNAVNFNDTRTHPQVIAAFDEAIAAQGGE